MRDSYYEPPDEYPCDNPDCGLEDEHDECYTRDDWLADKADEMRDRIKDGEGDWYDE